MKQTAKWGGHVRLLMILAAAFVFALAGCERDAHLADLDVRVPDTGPVTAFGHRLDKNASIEEVVYVFLQAVVADYDAGEDLKARNEAIDIELRLAAPERILSIAEATGRLRGHDPDEYIFNVVRHWAPVLGFYRDDFRVDFETLKARMLVVPEAPRTGQPPAAQVFLNVAYPDPTKRPGANVVAHFGLVQEQGYWRIWYVGWDNTTRDWKTNRPASARAAVAAARRAAQMKTPQSKSDSN